MLGKVLSGVIPPISLTFLRWFPAFIILALLFFRSTIQALPITKKHFGIIWLLGMLGVVAFPATLYEGLKTTTALNASLYLAVVPVLVLFLNLWVYQERIKPIIFLGAVLSLIGVVWLLSQGEIGRLTTLNINHGDLWAIGSALSWAVYCCIIRKRPTNISNTAFLTTLVGLAVITLTPFFIYEYATSSAKIIENLTASQWLGVDYLIIGPSILSYAFWNFGIAIVGNAKGAVMTNFTPLFAALFSILLLGEEVQSYHIVSTVLITLGVVICGYKKA